MLLPVPHLDGWLAGRSVSRSVSRLVGWLAGWLVAWLVGLMKAPRGYPPAPSWVTHGISEGESLAGRTKLINAMLPVGSDVRTPCSAGCRRCLLLSMFLGNEKPVISS